MFIENIAKCFKYNKKKSLHKIYTKSKIPHLWLFTDDIKTQNLQKFLAKIPQNSGIVIRNYLSEDRIKIISERENCDSTEAESRLNNRDKARQIYFERYFNLSDPDDIRHYDFMINTSKITEEYATEMIVNAATSIGSRKFYRLSKTA